METQTPMPPTEAQLWLAGLKKPCPKWTPLTIEHGPACPDCHGSGKVPVLPGLRVWCPCGDPKVACPFCLSGQPKDCLRCQGRGWIPKESLEALHRAMNKAGWDVEIHQGFDGARFIRLFWQRAPIVIGNHSIFPDSEGADDWPVAVKALKAAGYG